MADDGRFLKELQRPLNWSLVLLGISIILFFGSGALGSDILAAIFAIAALLSFLAVFCIARERNLLRRQLYPAPPEPPPLPKPQPEIPKCPTCGSTQILSFNYHPPFTLGDLILSFIVVIPLISWLFSSLVPQPRGRQCGICGHTWDVGLSGAFEELPWWAWIVGPIILMVVGWALNQLLKQWM